MRFSRRAQRLAESATMRVNRLATELKARGESIIDLSAGQPDFPSPAVAVEAAIRALRDGHTRYTPAAGTADLRRALAERYARDFAAPWELSDTLITVGAKAALFELIHVLVDDGDRVLIPSPCWVSFEEQVRFAGGTPITVPMSADDGFTIHAAPLIEAMDERTRVVLINSPCNPTGGLVSAVDLRRLAEACAERDAILLCDETYERFVYDGAEHASGAALAREFPDTVVLVASFSKTWSMTGWRLGWALGPRPIIAKAIEVQSHATSNPTSFAMFGALAALEGAEDDVRTMLEAFAARRTAVVAALDRLPGFACRPPGGAFYAFPEVSACYGPGREGSVEMAEFLLKEAGVALVPGLAFGNDAHLRLAFACSVEDLEEGVERIGRVL